MAKNIALLWEPHFKTKCMRVDTRKQQGETNFIIVCCSPSYNGIYKWDGTNKYDTIKNGKITCYCVPIDDCIKIKELSDMKNPDLINLVRMNQLEFLKRQKRKSIPDWVLEAVPSDEF